MLIAITRAVSRTIVQCELTYLARTPIDIATARRQHQQYEQCLADLGCQLIRLPEAPDLPDAVFVEDTAVVFDECALITRPGAASRQAETIAIAQALKPYRRLLHIEPPGTVDGGDVLRTGRKIFVGMTPRTNQTGIAQLTALLAPYGYEVRGVPVRGCLHLKSAVTQVAENTLLINRQWTDAEAFAAMQLIETDAAEPFAGNALMINSAVVYPAEFPATRQRLAQHGLNVVIVPAAELGKAEGGVTCCSLIFSA